MQLNLMNLPVAKECRVILDLQGLAMMTVLSASTGQMYNINF